MEKLLKATHEGVLPLGENELSVAVLSDGTRLITQSAVFKAFGRTKRGRALNENRVPNMPAFIDANNLQVFVNQGVIDVLKLIDYLDKNNKKSNGYNALILPKLCKVYLDAREAKVLKPQQLPLARASEILLLGLSDIGIIALVDEATGYQYEREKDELQKILKAYISESLLPWQKRFPDEFYKEIFRLNAWEFTVNGIRNRPGVIGTWTKKLVYNHLPKGVLQELEKKTPKSESGNYTARLHQSLTINLGEPHLTKQLVSIITLMNISSNWKEFIQYYNKKFGQQEFDFLNEDSSQKLFLEENKISTFDNSLKAVLSVPPLKKDK